MSLSSGRYFEPELLAPSLRQVFGENAPDPGKLLYVPIATSLHSEDPKPPSTYERTEVPVLSGEAVLTWPVPSLRALYRGQKVPPDLGGRPAAYEDIFALYDYHLADFSDVHGAPRDEELGEIFSTIRRRPDGKSIGFLHDFFWQVSALMLGTRELSEAEFTAILTRLERSCRAFAMGPSSRNFATTVMDLHFNR